MKKLSENKSKIVASAEEELELAKVLEEISQDERLQEVTVPPSVAQKLYARIHAYEEGYEEAKNSMDSPETTQAIIEMAGEEESVEDTQEDIQEDIQVETKVVKYKRRSKKTLLILAAAFILTLAMGMVGVGEDFKWLEVGKKEVESYSTIAVESDADIIQVADMDEQAAYEYAQEILGVSVMKMPAIVDGFVFDSIQTLGDTVGVVMFYSYEDSMVQYSVIQNYNALSHNEISIGTLVESYYVDAIEGEVLIEVYSEVDGTATMKATYTCNNVYYSIKGVVEQGVFEEVVKNIIFF